MFSLILFILNLVNLEKSTFNVLYACKASHMRQHDRVITDS